MTPEQQQAFRYLLANCMVQSDKPDDAIPFYRHKALQGELRACEGLVDAYAERFSHMARDGRRDRLVRKAGRLLSWVLARQLQEAPRDLTFFRYLWKQARLLEKIDSRELTSFFRSLDREGISPDWDADSSGSSRWGYRDRMEALRTRTIS
jgi:hypothetical protein